MALVALPFGLAAAFVVLVVGSGLFRAAAALANRAIGPVRSDEPIGWDWDADEDDEDLAPGDRDAVPEPGIWLGMRVLFLAGLAHLAVVFVLEFVLDEVLRIRRGVESGPGFVLTVALGFLATAGVAAWLLPTTPRRAALVTLFFYLFLAAIGAVVYGLLSAVFR